MKMSTKGRYGLRSLVDLAVYSGGSHVSLNSIAERQNISEHYLEQVFSTLRKSGLVKSVKGAQGGYILADKPSGITVGRVLRALEGDLSIIDDKKSENIQQDNKIEYCIRINVWDKLYQSINSVVDSITLEDLVQEYKKLDKSFSLMFYI